MTGSTAGNGRARSVGAALATALALSPLAFAGDCGPLESKLRFEVSFAAATAPGPVDGRLLLLISADGGEEPRFQISDGPGTQLVFGVDIDGLKPGEDAAIDGTAFGYPLATLAELPPGEYRVQALINRYETFCRSDGHAVKLPPDRGEGQQWNRKPGNLYSRPAKMRLDPRKEETLRITLDQVIAEIPDPPETKYIKHLKIRSRLLSEFWGRPMFLGAHVLLPEGFDRHPEARYPLIVFHGHFPYTFGGFRETPPDPDLKPEYSERFKIEGYNRIEQEYAYEFYKYWTADDTPRFLIIEVQHANPYYDDSYAVNSANLGPYGDAITYELIPEVEKRFRGIGQGWAQVPLRRLDGRLGGARGPGLLSRRIQRLLGRLPGPDRFPGLHGRQYLRAQERLLCRQPVEADAPARPAQSPGRGADDARASRTTGSSRWERAPVRATSGTSGRRFFRPSAKTDIRSGSGTS